MKRLILLTLCVLFLASASLGDACAQDAAKTLEPAAQVRAAAKAKQAKAAKGAPKAKASKKAEANAQAAKGKAAKGKTAKGQSAKAQAGKAQADGHKLSKEELLSPYSAQDALQNATRWDFDPTPTARPFAKPEEPAALNLRLGREEVVDPLTRKEVTPKPDPAAAKDNLKNMDLKGALDKVGGKAEVQMEILKF